MNVLTDVCSVVVFFVVVGFFVGFLGVGGKLSNMTIWAFCFSQWVQVLRHCSISWQ